MRLAPGEAQRLDDLIHAQVRRTVLRTQTVASFAELSLLIMLLAITVVGGVVLPALSTRDQSLGDRASLVGGLCLCFVIYLPVFRTILQSGVPGFLALLGSLAAEVLAVVAGVAVVDVAQPLVVGVLVVVGYMVTVGATLTLATVLLTIATSALVVRLRYPIVAQAQIFSSLFNGLLVASQSNRWPSIHARQQLLEDLEQAAACFERDLPRVLRGCDPNTDAWFRTRGREIAASVRHLKYAVLTQSDTRGWLVDQLAGRLSRLVVGDWDGLPRAPATPVPPRQIIRSYLARLWSLLVGAALPVGLTLLLLHNGVLPDPADKSVPVAAFAFAVLTLIFTLDPNSHTTFGALKDAAPWFGLPHKCKGSGAE
ncbi:MAG: hypothetical protein JOZ87_09225 [Chloroflexi bacterium]|nr:hypothetical protein [Chloroflexota bacterium]